MEDDAGGFAALFWVSNEGYASRKPDDLDLAAPATHQTIRLTFAAVYN
jgi:hypothetical protein